MGTLIRPDSYTALRLMGLGVTFDELEDLSHLVNQLATDADQHNQSFYNDAFVNLYYTKDWLTKDGESINKLVLNNLKLFNVDTSLVNLTSVFKEQVTEIQNSVNPQSNINAYIRNATPDRFLTFLIRNTDHLCPSFRNAFVTSILRKEASKNIRTIAQRSLTEYHAKHLTSNKKQHALLQRLQKEIDLGDTKEAEFVSMIRQRTNHEKLQIDIVKKSIQEDIEAMLPAFSSGQLGIPQSQAIDNLFRLFSENSSASNTAFGIRRNSKENFIERAKELLPILVDRGLKDKALLSVLINLSGAQGDIDPAMLLYVDPIKPNTYNVPKNLQETVKIHNLAMKISRFNIDLFDMHDFIEKQIIDTPILSHLGARWTLNVDAYHMVAKGYVAGKIYGEEEEAWNTFLEVKNMVDNFQQNKHMTLGM